MAKLQDRFFNRVIEGKLELDEAEKAQAVSDLQGADVKVKSLEVINDSNLKGDIKLNGESALQSFNGVFQDAFLQGLTLVSSFCKVVRNFNELQFICNFRVKNETESPIIIINDTLMVEFELPENLQGKIYAHNGVPCSANPESSQGAIAMALLTISGVSGQVDGNGPRYASLFHYAGKLRYYFEGGNFSVGVDETKDFEARISLAL